MIFLPHRFLLFALHSRRRSRFEFLFRRYKVGQPGNLRCWSCKDRPLINNNLIISINKELKYFLFINIFKKYLPSRHSTSTFALKTVLPVESSSYQPLITFFYCIFFRLFIVKIGNSIRNRNAVKIDSKKMNL